MVSQSCPQHFVLLVNFCVCTGAISIAGSTFSGNTFTPFVSSVSCTGDESDLLSCSLDSSATVCSGQAKAGVACQGLYCCVGGVCQ